MSKYPSFEYMASEKGFVFPQAREWIDGNVCALAQDAALVTTPNTGVPVELTAYIDPRVVEVLTAVRNARAIFPEVQKGNWTTTYDKWGQEEYTGDVEPYTDFGNGRTSGVNYNWLSREQFVFQTTIEWGDRELAVSSEAKINLAAKKQVSAARTIDIAANKFYLYGVQGKEIYGFLNDPNLPSAVAVTSWANKTAEAIYNDINGVLFANLVANSGGHITPQSRLQLILSTEMSVALGTTNNYGKTVQEMLERRFPKLEYIELPELSAPSGEKIFMVAPDVDGDATAELGFGVKMLAGRVIQQLSGYAQKFVGSTYGCILYRPFAIASINGMDAAG